MKRQGTTLVEVLVAAILSGAIVTALATAFAVSVRHEREFTRPRRQFESEFGFEDRLRSLLAHTVYTGEERTYFIALSTSGNSATADSLRFTVQGARLSGPVANSQEEDFQARNATFGPTGGVTEVALSLNPVGDAGGQTGLFIRKQTPSDVDPEQGGFESVLDPTIERFSLEFWDQTAWISTWDTTEDGALPTAVRVTYGRTGEETDRTFIVRLPNAQGGQTS